MKIGIVGMGLMGGSLGRALLKITDNRVYGADIDESAMLKAELLEAQTDRLTKENAGDLDMIVFALCPRAAIQSMREYCPLLKKGAIVADLCGNKRIIVEEMKLLSTQYNDLFFVGTHPMAGREYSGISHSSSTLFEHSYIILVPVTQNLEKLSVVKNLCLEIGAQDVEICTAEQHDKMIAYTSQLAHIVSGSYIKNPKSAVHAGFSAGSFRDLTRVAKLDPEMWSELFIENKDNLTGDIEVLISRLKEFKNALDNSDSKMLIELLRQSVIDKERAERSKKERLK